MTTSERSLEIRPAVLEDATAIAALSHQLGYPTDSRSVRRRLEPLLASPEHAVFVAAEADGELLGWVHAAAVRRVESEPYAELGGLVVDAGHRGTGVGSALVRRAESWADGRGLAVMRVRSNVAREGAHRFYERRGYRRAKTQHVFAKKLARADDGLG